MLGMVNYALQEMVTERLGAEAWESIRVEAEVADRVFVIMKQYPDEVTYRLAGIVAQRMGVGVPDALHAFGHYWMAFAERQPWGKVMHSMASNVRELIPALNEMHSRIALSFPGVTMPQFRCDDAEGGSLLVHYFSPRPGLAPFVQGVLEGIGAMYGETIEVDQVEYKDRGASHDVFRIRFPAAAA
jgi:hypothetical protein